MQQYQQSAGALQRLAQLMRVAEPELVEQVEKTLAREGREAKVDLPYEKAQRSGGCS